MLKRKQWLAPKPFCKVRFTFFVFHTELIPTCGPKPFYLQPSDLLPSKAELMNPTENTGPTVISLQYKHPIWISTGYTELTSLAVQPGAPYNLVASAVIDVKKKKIRKQKWSRGFDGAEITLVLILFLALLIVSSFFSTFLRKIINTCLCRSTDMAMPRELGLSLNSQFRNLVNLAA